MIISDTVPKEHEDWLKKLVKEMEEEVTRLFLVYDEGKYGPDTAREIWDKVVGEDFVPATDSGILANEEIRACIQRGVVHVADPVPEGQDHHWWVEVWISEKELWEVLEL